MVLLNGLLRPLIQRQWAARVAQINQLPESRLEEFLFGASRIPLEPVRPGLQEIQENRCFYCDGRIGDVGRDRPHVDHFIPWARYPNNAIENLVLAHDRCNGHKRDYLAASEHVARWRAHAVEPSRAGSDRRVLAESLGWESDPGRSLGVTRGIYLHLPQNVPLWLRSDKFEPFDSDDLTPILGP